MDRAYTIKEVAEIFNCHIETVRRSIAKGKIKAFKIGNEWRVSKEEVERIMRGE